MVHLQKEDESKERNRASFPRWGKLRVISYHFTENSFFKSRKWGCVFLQRDLQRKGDFEDEASSRSIHSLLIG